MPSINLDERIPNHRSVLIKVGECAERNRILGQFQLTEVAPLSNIKIDFDLGMVNSELNNSIILKC